MASQHRRFTVDEFLAWSVGSADERHHLVDGEIVAMAPPNARYHDVAANIYVGLRHAIRDAALSCRAYFDALGVALDARSMAIPDVLVSCPAVPPEARSAEPEIVVEVLSDSTAQDDTGRKMRGYVNLSSLSHYLIVDFESQTVMHYPRTGSGFVVAFPTAAVVLDPPGITVAVASFFETP